MHAVLPLQNIFTLILILKYYVEYLYTNAYRLGLAGQSWSLYGQSGCFGCLYETLRNRSCWSGSKLAIRARAHRIITTFSMSTSTESMLLSLLTYMRPHLRHIVTRALYQTRAVLSPGNRAKPCKFPYVKSVRNFMWKLCYRKDDRAMRRLYTWVPWLFPKFFMGFCSDRPYECWMFLRNLKSVALPVPEIRGGN